MIQAMDNGLTQEKLKNEIASGITAVPITAANQAGLKCSVMELGVALNGSAIFSSMRVEKDVNRVIIIFNFKNNNNKHIEKYIY